MQWNTLLQPSASRGGALRAPGSLLQLPTAGGNMRIGQKVCHTDLTAAWQPTCTPAYIAAPVVHSQREQGGDTSPADAAGPALLAHCML